MFRRHEVTLTSNPVCYNLSTGLREEDFLYYDKDGFELNQAEQKFYAANSLPLIDCLNHRCWQEPWFELLPGDHRLILDHSMFLCRASYQGNALNQLHELKSKIPTTDLLIRTKQKWGFDFALDAIADDGTIYEVLHIEYDNYNYDVFNEQFILFDFKIRHTDWKDSAKEIWKSRDQWQHLKGFEQNHWKSNFLLGWHKAEYTEKSI